MLLAANFKRPGVEALPTFKNPTTPTSPLKVAEAPVSAPLKDPVVPTTAPVSVPEIGPMNDPAVTEPPKVVVPVTPRVPPIVALFVTLRAVPAAVAVNVVAVSAPEERVPKMSFLFPTSNRNVVCYRQCCACSIDR